MTELALNMSAATVKAMIYSSITIPLATQTLLTNKGWIVDRRTGARAIRIKNAASATTQKSK